MSTTIRVSRKTKDKLESLGHKKDTFDSIIMSLYYEHMMTAIAQESNSLLFDPKYDDIKKTVQFIFTNIDYEIPSTYTDADGTVKEWETDPLDWAIEMARDEDFIGHNNANPPLVMIAVNVFCLLEEIPAPTWSFQRKNPFAGD